MAVVQECTFADACQRLLKFLIWVKVTGATPRHVAASRDLVPLSFGGSSDVTSDRFKIHKIHSRSTKLREFSDPDSYNFNSSNKKMSRCAMQPACSGHPTTVLDLPSVCASFTLGSGAAY